MFLSRKPPRHLLPVVLVVAVHAAALAGLWMPAPALVAAAPSIDVQIISEQLTLPVEPQPVKPPPEPPRPRPKPEPQVKPRPEPVPEPKPQPAAEPVASTPPPPPQAPAPAAPVEAPVVTTPPRIDASYRGNAKPSYPMASRRLKEEGTVHLRLFVNADGTVGEVKLARSSGFERLDQAAMQTVRKWKLIPARRGSEPFATWYELPLTFNLEN